MILIQGQQHSRPARVTGWGSLYGRQIIFGCVWCRVGWGGPCLSGGARKAPHRHVVQRRDYHSSRPNLSECHAPMAFCVSSTVLDTSKDQLSSLSRALSLAHDVVCFFTHHLIWAGSMTRGKKGQASANCGDNNTSRGIYHQGL